GGRAEADPAAHGVEDEEAAGSGVEIEVTPAGKATRRLSLLSGGEKALVALAFVFAVFLARPSPFYILDEVEAALDDANIDRFLQLVRRFSDRAQFVVVTHQKRTMDAADVLYGVSMGADAAPHVSAPKTVVPSAGLPKKVAVDRSNANLAIARYRGRIYLVFRTAKWQIADDNARLYVISSKDQRHWRYEGKFAYGRDLREPRFLVYHHRLLLYFALLGSNPAAFEPGGLR